MLQDAQRGEKDRRASFFPRLLRWIPADRRKRLTCALPHADLSAVWPACRAKCAFALLTVLGLITLSPTAGAEICVELSALGIEKRDPALRQLHGAPKIAAAGLVKLLPHEVDVFIATASPFDVATVFALDGHCVLAARHFTLQELLDAFQGKKSLE